MIGEAFIMLPDFYLATSWKDIILWVWVKQTMPPAFHQQKHQTLWWPQNLLHKKVGWP